MSSQARIQPLDDEEMTSEQRVLLEGIGGVAGEVGAVNIFRTLVRHPGLFRRWLPFGGKLLAGKLPARDREILILRTAVNCDAPYEWAQHVRIGRSVGLTNDEIDRIKRGPAAWDGLGALLLQAADELHGTSTIADATWSALAEVYNEQQLVEVPMVVGHYHLVAFTLNALGVQVEDGSTESGAG